MLASTTSNGETARNNRREMGERFDLNEHKGASESKREVIGQFVCMTYDLCSHLVESRAAQARKVVGQTCERSGAPESEHSVLMFLFMFEWLALVIR